MFKYRWSARVHFPAAENSGGWTKPTFAFSPHVPSCRLSFPAAYSALFRTAHIWHPLNYIACLLTLLFVVAAVGCCGWGVGPLELYFWEIVANFLRIAKLNFAAAPRCMASALAARAVDQAVPQQRPQNTRQQPKEKPPRATGKPHPPHGHHV